VWYRVYTKSIGSEQCSTVFVLPCIARAGFDYSTKVLVCARRPGHHQFCVWSNCCFRPVNVYLHSCTSRITAVHHAAFPGPPNIRADTPFIPREHLPHVCAHTKKPPPPRLPSIRHISCRAYIIYVLHYYNIYVIIIYNNASSYK